MGFFIWRTNLDVVRHSNTDAASSARRVHCRSVLLSITSALVACVEINRGKLNMETNQIRRMSISGPLHQKNKTSLPANPNILLSENRWSRV